MDGSIHKGLTSPHKMVRAHHVADKKIPYTSSGMITQSRPESKEKSDSFTDPAGVADDRTGDRMKVRVLEQADPTR